MISFLMPALNEEDALPVVIKSIPVSKLKTVGYSVEIVVVDLMVLHKQVELMKMI